MSNIVAKNPTAYHNYFIEDTIEARNCSILEQKLNQLEMEKLI